jgi:hypothetical protein
MGHQRRIEHAPSTSALPRFRSIAVSQQTTFSTGSGAPAFLRTLLYIGLFSGSGKVINKQAGRGAFLAMTKDEQP